MFELSLGKGRFCLGWLVGLLACRSTSRGVPRASSALSATFPCVTLSPSGAQAGEMPTDRKLFTAALNGKLAEVWKLLQAHANIDEKDQVSDGTGKSVAAGVLVWHVVWNMVQGCGGVNAAECVGLDKFLSSPLRFSNEDLTQESRKRRGADGTRQEKTSGPDTGGRCVCGGFSGYDPPPPSLKPNSSPGPGAAIFLDYGG